MKFGAAVWLIIASSASAVLALQSTELADQLSEAATESFLGNCRCATNEHGEMTLECETCTGGERKLCTPHFTNTPCEPINPGAP